MFSLLSMSFADADRRPQTMSSLDLTDMQPEWWASNFYGDGKMNNYNMRAGDLFDPPTQTISFARNSTSNTRLQGSFNSTAPRLAPRPAPRPFPPPVPCHPTADG